jgi:uncharacterized membrane-anchored protein
MRQSLQLQMFRSLGTLVAAILALVIGTGALHARISTDDEEDDAESEQSAKVTHGPAAIDLSGQGTLALSSGYRFVARKPEVPAAKPATTAKAPPAGTTAKPSTPTPVPDAACSDGVCQIGVIVSGSDQISWLMYLAFQPIGYAAPEVISSLSPDAIIDHIKQSNKPNPAKRGVGARELWRVRDVFEPPRYDAALHRLRVGTHVTQLGPTDMGEDMADVSTYLFLRHGVLHLRLIAPESEIATRRAHADALLAGMTLGPGKKPKDFVPETDAVVAHPLAMIFGGQTLEDINAQAAEVAADKAADVAAKVRRVVAAEQTEGWTVWLAIGLGVIAVGAFIAAFMLGGDKRTTTTTQTSSSTARVTRTVRV